MIMIETREAAKEKAFDLLEDIKQLGKKKKMALCELEETLYDCFESDGEDEYDDTEDSGFRYRSRRQYRDHHDDMYDDEEDRMHGYRRRGMRMRRSTRSY